MIKFEMHDNQLFRMLDKPVPLTPDAELPCLVRLIQDDSPMGKYNRDAAYSDVIGKPFVAQKIKENPFYSNKLHAYEKNSLNQDDCIASIHTLEVIGYPVAEGSKEWALYQMMQGEKICHKTFPSIVYCKHADGIRREERRTYCVDYMYVSVWLNRVDNNGWQIYKEPESQYKVGDWVEFIDAGGRKSQGEYLSNAYDNDILVLDITYNLRCVVPTTKIIRKLSPSEVVIRIGCLSGKVAHAISDDCFLLVKVNDPQYGACYIDMSMLDIPTRKLVESLLKAQEEEK